MQAPPVSPPAVLGDALVGELLARVPEGARAILDLTCYRGELAAALKARRAGAGGSVRVVGADHRAEMARAAQGAVDEAFQGNPIRVAFPWLPKSFDAVIAAGTFDLVDDPVRLAGYVYHWVKPSGTVVAWVASQGARCAHSPGELALPEILEGVGLKIDSVEPSAAGGTLVVARRPSELDAFRPVRVASVVIVVRNQADLLARTLRSLSLGNQGATFEVIIVDAGSSDRLATMETSEDGSIVVVRQPGPVGLAAGYESAARVAHSKILCFLEPGIEVGAGFLREAERILLEENRNIGALVPTVLGPDGKVLSAGYEVSGSGPAGKVSNPHRGAGVTEPSVAARRPVHYVPLEASVVRRTAYEMVFGLDPALEPQAAGLDLASKLIAEEWEIFFDPTLRLVRR